MLTLNHNDVMLNLIPPNPPDPLTLGYNIYKAICYSVSSLDMELCSPVAADDSARSSVPSQFTRTF